MRKCKERSCKDYDTCPLCIKAKQISLRINTDRSKAKRPLEIIHTIVCGPIDPTTYDDKEYFLTRVDDFTHFWKNISVRKQK
jgi:hypothetical protein